MKRVLSGMLVVCALVTMASAATASEWYMKMSQVTWKTSKGVETTAQTFSDSVTIALGGVSDTTEAISLADYAWDNFAGSLSANTMPLMRVYLTTPNVGTYTAADSLAWAVDGSMDGANWYGVQGLSGTAIRATLPKVLSFMVSTLAGGTDANMFASSTYQRYIRLRITAVSSHTFTAAKCFIYYPAIRLAQ